MRKGERKQFCPYGHDTFICGRDNGNQCKICKNKYRKVWKQKHKKRLKIKSHTYYKRHKKHHRELMKNWNKKYKKQLNEHFVNRRRIDINFRLTCNLRSRLGMAIKNNQKTGSAVKDLGCSIDFFKKYIQSKFHGGMAWNNWGTVWELDHIKELHTFNLSKRKEFLKACHYTNFQPLTIKDHKRKTAKYAKNWKSK